MLTRLLYKLFFHIDIHRLLRWRISKLAEINRRKACTNLPAYKEVLEMLGGTTRNNKLLFKLRQWHNEHMKSCWGKRAKLEK